MQLISQNIAGDNPLYNVAYVEELQDSIDSRVARAINKLLASKIITRYLISDKGFYDYFYSFFFKF